MDEPVTQIGWSMSNGTNYIQGAQGEGLEVAANVDGIGEKGPNKVAGMSVGRVS